MIPVSRRRLFQGGVVLSLASATVMLVPHGSSPAADLDTQDDYCVVAPATPYDAASDVAMFDARAVPADARCPVCGMYPSLSPRWAAQTIFKDGAAQFFDSPLNLYVFLGNVSRYSGAYGASDVAASFVTDADGGGWIPARHAYYVHGSDALGPMRNGNLPAFGVRDTAERFAAKRGGTVLTADEITPEVLRGLTHDIHRHDHRSGR